MLPAVFNIPFIVLCIFTLSSIILVLSYVSWRKYVGQKKNVPDRERNN
ncbi:sporulation protein YpjB [Jeotgalibacillus malaysiensis]